MVDYPWRPLPFFFSALDVDHQAQSFDSPTAARQSWRQRLVETATQTVPINVAPPLRDTHSSGHDAHTQTHTLSLDAFTQSVPPSSFTQDASTQFSRSVFPRRRICSESRSRATDSCLGADGSTPVLQEQRDVPPPMCPSRFTDLPGPPSPPGLVEHSQRPASRLVPSKAHAPTSDAQCQYRPGREHRMRAIILPLRCLMPALPRRDNIDLLPPTAAKRVLSVPHRREHNPSSATLLAQVTNHSRSLRLRFFRWSVLPSPKPAGRAPLSTRTATSCITSTASPCSSGIRAQHANTPHKFWRRPAEDAMRSSCKKPVIMHESRTSSLRTRAARTLPILLNKDTFEPDAAVCAISESLPAGARGKWLHWWFVDCCVAHFFQALPRSRSAQSMSTMLWPKKHDASTSLLRRLSGHMVQHNVDFIGGDFNMSAFSTAGDVFADPELAAPGKSLLWSLGCLDDSCRECTGFIITPLRPHEQRVDAHGCCKFDNAELGFGPRDQTAHFPVYLHFRTTNPSAQCSGSAATHGSSSWQVRAKTAPQATCAAVHLASFGQSDMSAP